MMNSIEILGAMEYSCPIRCDCYLWISDKKELVLTWKWDIRGLSFKWNEAIRIEELKNPFIIEGCIRHAENIIRSMIDDHKL